MSRIRLFTVFDERPTRPIKKVVLHCSASDYGDRALLYKWHVLDNGWSDIGYHFFILNGQPKPKFYAPEQDGLIMRARPLNIKGAHCKGDNHDSIGICLIGNEHFTSRQFHSLTILLDEIKYVYPEIELYGHYGMPSGKEQGKTCPNLNMDWVRILTRIKNEKA